MDSDNPKPTTRINPQPQSNRREMLFGFAGAAAGIAMGDVAARATTNLTPRYSLRVGEDIGMIRAKQIKEQAAIDAELEYNKREGQWSLRAAIAFYEKRVSDLIEKDLEQERKQSRAQASYRA